MNRRSILTSGMKVLGAIGLAGVFKSTSTSAAALSRTDGKYETWLTPEELVRLIPRTSIPISPETLALIAADPVALPMSSNVTVEPPPALLVAISSEVSERIKRPGYYVAFTDYPNTIHYAVKADGRKGCLRIYAVRWASANPWDYSIAIPSDEQELIAKVQETIERVNKMPGCSKDQSTSPRRFAKANVELIERGDARPVGYFTRIMPEHGI